MSTPTPDMTFALPGELYARAEAAHAAYAEELRLAAGQLSGERARALAAARRRLAASYRELASNVSFSPVMFEAFDRMAAQHHADSIDDVRWAERLESSTFGGDME